MRNEERENILTYARRHNKKLHVVITGRDKESAVFNMTAKELDKSIQRHCLWYDTMKSSESFNEFSMQINLLNGIRFDIMLW